ncbi:hypothetical protein JHK82_016741 [Glycine max]|nr:hypothetical protein JHK82_016741 [Glycine max]
MASNGESDERPYRGSLREQLRCARSASIIWVSPDTNTWVQNPYKSSNGELALDIILEEEAVKQSGDAWRIWNNHFEELKAGLPKLGTKVSESEVRQLMEACQHDISCWVKDTIMITGTLLDEHTKWAH